MKLDPEVQKILDRGMAWQLSMRPVNEPKVRVSVWFQSFNDALDAMQSLYGNTAVSYAAIYRHQPWLSRKEDRKQGWAFVSRPWEVKPK